MCALTGQTHQILILTAQLGMMPLVSVQPGISVPGTIRPTLKSAMISHSGVPSIAQMEPHALPSRTQQTFGMIGMITQIVPMMFASNMMRTVHVLSGDTISTITVSHGMMSMLQYAKSTISASLKQMALSFALLSLTHGVPTSMLMEIALAW